MRLLSVLLVPAGALVWAQSCTPDGCLRALEDVKATARNGTADCLSVLQTTTTPAAVTIFHTLSVTRTSTTTRNTTVTSGATATATDRTVSPRAPADEPWRRWLDRRDALAHLGRSPESGSPALPTNTPGYASECGSPASYVSACSCLGVRPAVVTASPELTTSTVFATAWATQTMVRTRFANSTGWNATTSARLRNSTGTAVSTKRGSTSKPLLSTESARATEEGSSGTITASGSSTRTSSVTAAAAASTSTEAASSSRFVADAPFSNSTSPAVLNSTTVRVANQSRADSTTAPTVAQSTSGHVNTTIVLSTGTGSPQASARPTGWYPFPNATAAAPAPFANATAPTLLASSATPPFQNASTVRPFNSTVLLSTAGTAYTRPSARPTGWYPFPNATAAAPFANTTAPAQLANATIPRPLNATTARYWNSTAPPRALNTSTPTATIDRTCGETAAAFNLAVSQPGGFVDEYLLRQSGSSVVLVADEARSSRFSVGASGRLCAVGRSGALGNALVAVVESRRNATADASPLWFVDGGLVANLTDRGYAELRCDQPGAAGGSLECSHDDMAAWMGCGLQVTLSSGTEPTFEGMECRPVELLVSAAGGGNGTAGNVTFTGTSAPPSSTALFSSGASPRPTSPASTAFVDVRRRSGWGAFIGPIFGFGSDDMDL